MKYKVKQHDSTIKSQINCSPDDNHRLINRNNNLHYRCKLTRINRKFHLEILSILVLFNLIENILGNPVFVDNPSIAQFQSGRNIRHLPCIVRKSGLSGTCMFAIDCIKQNGTHLGTCIDRFYFGSCCQMKEDLPFHAQDIIDNSVDQNTISHYVHESSTNVPHTSALFKLTNESHVIGNSESLLKNHSTNLGDLTTIHIPMQNRESPTKPQKISIEMETTNKPVTKETTSGNLTTILPTTSSLPSTLTSELDLLTNDITSESISMLLNTLVTSSTPNKITQVPIANNSLPIETFSTQSFSSLPSTLPLQTTTANPIPSILPLQTTTATPERLKPLHTSTNFVLTTTKTTERPFKTTTEETKFSTFQVVETTTPFVPLVTHSSLSSSSSSSSASSSSSSSLPSSSSSSLQRLPQTTNKPSSKKPVTTINVTNKPITTKRYTTHRTKITRRPIVSSKPTISSTQFHPLVTKKSPPTKATTVRIQQSSSTRRTTIPSKRPPIKRPTTTSTLRPKPISKRPATTLVTNIPKIDTNHIRNATVSFGKPIQNDTTTKTTKRPSTTQLPLVPAATKAPRPKPKPTANIVRVSPSIISENITEIMSTVAPSSIPVTIKPLLITGKPLTTKPLPTSHQTEKIPLSSAIDTSTASTLLPIINSTSSKPNITESTTTITTPPPELTTIKPSGLVTWTKVDDESKNHTDKNDDWIPRPPPDWILLPTIKPDIIETNKTIQMTTPSKQNVSTTDELPNKSEGTQTSPPTIVTFTTILPETNSQLTNFINQSSTEGLLSLNTENNLNNSTTSTTTVNIIPETTITTTKSPQIPSLDGLDYKQICGKRMFPEPRIVGGANAAFGRWPWQISLRQWRTSTYLHKCGAALLNENWAITAAHCVDNVPPSDLLLRLGEYDLAEEDEPYSYQERRVQIVASHPQFDPRTFEYDLALLRFYEPVTFQPNIIPICVPDNDYDFLEQTAYVTGWGRLYEDGPLPSVLQEVSVPVINNTICETMYRAAGYIEHIPHIFICAGWKKGGYDSCEGDSGGPMVLQRDDKRFVLGGVISWGIGCAEPNQPGVYTRISEFRDWINQILQF